MQPSRYVVLLLLALHLTHERDLGHGARSKGKQFRLPLQHHHPSGLQFR